MSQTQQRFGLKEADARRAMEALMPAFWAGLRRNAATPDGMEGLMRAFTPPIFQPGGGAAANPWAAGPGAMWPQGGWPAGGAGAGDWMNAAAAGGPVGAFLTQIFPNKEIRRAVLDHVAATTGIRQDALDALMPVAATLMMGQIARNFAVGPARELLDAFMAGFARGRPQPAPSPVDMMAPFAEAMTAFFSGFARAGERHAPQAARPQEPEDEEAADAPDLDAPEPAASASEASGPAASDAAAPDDEDTGPSDKPSAGGAQQQRFLNDFLAAGRSMQESQIRAFEQMFDAFVPGHTTG